MLFYTQREPWEFEAEVYPHERHEEGEEEDNERHGREGGGKRRKWSRDKSGGRRRKWNRSRKRRG